VTAAPPLSIVIVARNEAASLPRLLRSLGPFLEGGGDVLVVDTGSTDDTTAVSAAGGCRVESIGGRFDSVLDEARACDIDDRFARNGEAPLVRAGSRMFHFGAARQYAGWRARHDMVLQLDASDEVIALDGRALRAHLAQDGVVLFQYELRLNDVALRVARFYDRRVFEWRGRSHEGLYGIQDRAGRSGSIQCGEQELLVRHHADGLKTRNYLPGLALDAMAHPDEPRWQHYLGRELYYQRRHASAIAVLEAHAALETAWRVERAQSLCFAGECYERLGRPPDAIDCYERAVLMDDSRREAHLRLAGLYCRLGDFARAALYAEQSLRIPRAIHYPEPQSHYTIAPHALLYWSLLWLGRRAEARLHWEECRRLAPDDAGVQEHGRWFW
jgi:tetratricopeptide (TPR) repeat protein